MTRPILTIASGNTKKVLEIQQMLGPLPLEVYKQPNNLNVEETGETYLENALLKARAAAKLTQTWTIADDSGLEVDALQGTPGIYSARYEKNNQDKIKKLLHELSDTPYRSALFRSVMVLCNSKGDLLAHAEGICWGEILKTPAYPNGEFESVLWVREANCTYGELNTTQLLKLGSRGKAARALSPELHKALGI